MAKGDPGQTDDVSFLCSEPEETQPVATDENGGMGPLNRKGIDRMAGHAVMPTGEGDLCTA